MAKYLLSLRCSFLSSVFLLNACQLEEKAAETKITNGKPITEIRYQSVIAIRAGAAGQVQDCTATFVNHFQAVTAAHCLEGMSPSEPAIYAAKFDAEGKEITSFSAENFFIHPDYNPHVTPNPHDLAVINFPRHAASTIALISSKAPEIGTWVQLVGYGDNFNFYDADGVLSGAGGGQKRVGTNKVFGYEKDMILIVGVPGETRGVSIGTQSCSGAGDSGGPLFINSTTLVGVTMGGGLQKGFTQHGEIEWTCGSYYVDLSLPQNIAFLESLLSYEIKTEFDRQTAISPSN